MTATGTRRLRILYVGTLPPHQGGSALTNLQLLAGLAGLGHRIEAIAPITEAARRSGDPLDDRGQGFKVTRFVLPYLDTSSDSTTPNEYLQQIEQVVACAIARRRPDVLFIGRESFAEHVTALADAHSLPSILRFAGGTMMGNLIGNYPARFALRLLDRFREADVAVTSARHMQRTLARLGVPGVQIIPNPVDLERFRPGPASPALRRALGVGRDDLVVAHFSNLKAVKRPLDIVHAAEIAVREDDRLVFLIVGDGPCRAALEDACGERGLAARFRFAGWVDYDHVPEFIKSADMVVMPSAAEAQARVYLETQASARTLVASDIPAAREVVEDGKTGLLFRSGDTAHLAARILLAARDSSLRAELGSRARERVVTHSLPRVVAAYGRLLESLAADRASSPQGFRVGAAGGVSSSG